MLRDDLCNGDDDCACPDCCEQRGDYRINEEGEGEEFGEVSTLDGCTGCAWRAGFAVACVEVGGMDEVEAEDAADEAFAEAFGDEDESVQ